MSAPKYINYKDTMSFLAVKIGECCVHELDPCISRSQESRTINDARKKAFHEVVEHIHEVAIQEKKMLEISG